MVAASVGVITSSVLTPAGRCPMAVADPGAVLNVTAAGVQPAAVGDLIHGRGHRITEEHGRREGCRGEDEK